VEELWTRRGAGSKSQIDFIGCSGVDFGRAFALDTPAGWGESDHRVVYGIVRLCDIPQEDRQGFHGYSLKGWCPNSDNALFEYRIGILNIFDEVDHCSLGGADVLDPFREFEGRVKAAATDVDYTSTALDDWKVGNEECLKVASVRAAWRVSTGEKRRDAKREYGGFVVVRGGLRMRCGWRSFGVHRTIFLLSQTVIILMGWKFPTVKHGESTSPISWRKGCGIRILEGRTCWSIV